MSGDQIETPVPTICEFAARDGTRLAIAIYKPAGNGPFPTLFAASPYRFDNNVLPASPQFLWRETGPIGLYVNEGYAYAHLDVRGSGRSGGSFGFLDSREQSDLYDAIAWTAAQEWSDGRVGSIGQSYYCMLQWFLGKLRPPALVCIGAHDGLADVYRAGCYHGGVACDFFPGYWWHQNRFINRHPAGGPARDQETDLGRLIADHPLFDDFWRERSAWDSLNLIEVPLFSSGVWGKMQLHTRGNIDAFKRARGHRKLRMSAAPNAWAAAAEFASAAFHREVMLPFYDCYLKGRETSWRARPPVEYAVRGETGMRVADDWPPPEARRLTFHLNGEPSGSVHSFNDGGLARNAPTTQGSFAYSYPDPGWAAGVVGFGPKGPAGGFDPARRVLTFTSAPFERDLVIAGPIRLALFASSSATDTDFFVKLSEQLPQRADEFARGVNPGFEVISRGWLKASHRALDLQRGAPDLPYHSHDRVEPLEPGAIYSFEISLEPQAYRLRAESRLRLEIVNGDSPVTEALWPHYYRPDKIGTDTVHYGGEYASRLDLHVLPA